MANDDRILNGSKVVVIDDHEDSLEIFRVALELCGAEVRGFATVPEAEDAIRADRPDAVVSDLDVRGGGIADMLTTAGRLGIPVLLLTGHTRQEDLACALAMGFDDYRVKPIEPMELCRAVEKLIERGPRPRVG